MLKDIEQRQSQLVVKFLGSNMSGKTNEGVKTGIEYDEQVRQKYKLYHYNMKPDSVE